MTRAVRHQPDRLTPIADVLWLDSEQRNPDPTSRQMLECIERVHPIPDLVDAVLATWHLNNEPIDRPGGES